MLHQKRGVVIKKIIKKRLAEIKAFNNTDFSDCPELTDYSDL
jgi:hypothetical protein